MEKKVSDTEVVFRDLTSTAKELEDERGSPLKVRRLIGSFITLSQQLTEIMRKEFQELTGKKWEAGSFPGWNVVTELFKKLRRSDYHESPVIIHVQETQYFSLGDIFGDDVKGGELASQGTWALGDPFSETIPEGIITMLDDPTTGQRIEPKRRDFVFIFYPGTDEIKKAIEDTGLNDIHKLAQGCLKILTEYFVFYQRSLKVELQSMRPGA
jgi:hypothetical protein